MANIYGKIHHSSVQHCGGLEWKNLHWSAIARSCYAKQRTWEHCVTPTSEWAFQLRNRDSNIACIQQPWQRQLVSSGCRRLGGGTMIPCTSISRPFYHVTSHLAPPRGDNTCRSSHGAHGSCSGGSRAKSHVSRSYSDCHESAIEWSCKDQVFVSSVVEDQACSSWT